VGDVTVLRLGEPIVVAGYPSEVGFTVTQGVFSGLKTSGGTEYVQTDAAINHGNSGGPLVNSAGELVRIADLILLNTQGIFFAVAASTAWPFVETGVTSVTTAPIDPVATAPTLMAVYYGYLQARDFYSAWSMLGEDLRAEQPFPTWLLATHRR
jgi:S1-C subfamily serine protease